MFVLGENGDGIFAVEDGNSERVAWIRDAVSTELDIIGLEAKWGNAEFITQGHQKHLEHARYQQKAILSGDFKEGLVQGLKLLPSLESISLEGGWSVHVLTNLYKHCFGSPLARTWDPFHLLPKKWYYGPSNEDFSYGMFHYQIITTAHVRAEKQIYELAVGGSSLLPSIPIEAFGRSFYASRSILGAGPFANLVRVSLRIGHWDEQPRGTNPEHPWDLPKLLGSMKSLRRLDLVLPLDGDNDPLLYRFSEVFPQHAEWGKLDTLVLYGLSSGIMDLLNLILFRMPALKSLELGEIELRDGTWEAVIECLQQCRKLSSFDIAHNARFFYNGASIRGTELFKCSFEAMEDYVLHGGRHPCLDDCQPDCAARWYVMNEDIEPALRERIVHAEA